LTFAHGQVSQKVKCPKCGRGFSRRDNLKAHIENVHREGASKFICHLCEKSFSSSSSLKRHLISPLHTGVIELQEVKYHSTSNCTSANVRWVFLSENNEHATSSSRDNVV